MLTEKERLDRALHHEEVDRPPCICPGGMMNMITTDLMDICGVTWPEAHTDAEMMANLALASYEQGCFENVGVPFCMTVEAEAMGAEVTMGTRNFEPHVTAYAADSVKEWKKPTSRKRKCLKSIICNFWDRRTPKCLREDFFIR